MLYNVDLINTKSSFFSYNLHCIRVLLNIDFIDNYCCITLDLIKTKSSFISHNLVALKKAVGLSVID
jgi:hypothetical protein